MLTLSLVRAMVNSLMMVGSYWNIRSSPSRYLMTISMMVIKHMVCSTYLSEG